jgi:hypothetical protein
VKLNWWQRKLIQQALGMKRGELVIRAVENGIFEWK